MKTFIIMVFCMIFTLSCSDDSRIINSNNNLISKQDSLYMNLTKQIDDLKISLEERDRAYSDDLIDLLDGQFAYTEMSIRIDTHDIDYVEWYEFTKSVDDMWDMNFTFSRVVKNSSWDEWQEHFPESLSPLIYVTNGTILFEGGTHITMNRISGSYFSLRTKEQQQMPIGPTAIDRIVPVGDNIFVGGQATGGIRYMMISPVEFYTIFD